MELNSPDHDLIGANYSTNNSLVEYFNETCKKYKKVKEVGPILQEIIVASNYIFNLSICLNTIKKVAKYLAHENEIIRNIAGTVIAALIGQAAELLSRESDPNIIKEAAKFLFKIIEKINELNTKGYITLSNDTEKGLKEVTKRILEFLAKTSFSKQDTFVNYGSQNQKNSNAVLSADYTETNQGLGLNPNKFSECLNKICERYKNARNTGPAIGEIISAVQGASDLRSCLAAIDALTKYLSKDNKLIRDIAATMIVLLLIKAIKFLSKETDPDTIGKAAQFLLEVVGKVGDLINKGQITLSRDFEASLKQSIKEILKLVVKSALPKNDEFVNHENQKNSELDLVRNKFINSLDGTRRSIVLGTGGDQFISSNNHQ